MDATNTNTTAIATGNTIIAIHGLAVKLSAPDDQHIVQTVPGKKANENGAGYEGFRAIVPAFTDDELINASTDPRLLNYLRGHLEASQRQLMRQLERNGSTSFTTGQLTLSAVLDFEASSGNSVARLTKELLGDILPAVRKAVAALFAEAKQLSDKLSEAEIMAASAATQAVYINMLQAIRGGAIPAIDQLRSLTRVIDLVGDMQALPTSGATERERYAFGVLRAKVASELAKAEETGDLVVMF